MILWWFKIYRRKGREEGIEEREKGGKERRNSSYEIIFIFVVKLIFSVEIVQRSLFICLFVFSLSLSLSLKVKGQIKKLTSDLTIHVDIRKAPQRQVSSIC